MLYNTGKESNGKQTSSILNKYFLTISCILLSEFGLKSRNLPLYATENVFKTSSP